MKVGILLSCSIVAYGSQGSGEEEDLDEDDSLSEDSGSEMQDDLQDDSEQSFGKSQPPTPSPSPPATPRPTRRHRKPRSPSFSDDENRPPSPKVRKVTVNFKMTLQQQILRTCLLLFQYRSLLFQIGEKKGKLIQCYVLCTGKG